MCSCVEDKRKIIRILLRCLMYAHMSSFYELMLTNQQINIPLPSVFRHGCFGIRKSIQPLKLSDEVLLQQSAKDLHTVQPMTLPPHLVLFH